VHAFPNWSKNDENKDLHRDLLTTILFAKSTYYVSKRSVNISNKHLTKQFAKLVLVNQSTQDQN
jgi:hypothetical protein